MILTIFFLSIALNFVSTSSDVVSNAQSTYLIYMEALEISTTQSPNSWALELIDSIHISSTNGDEYDQPPPALVQVYQTSQTIRGLAARITPQQLLLLQTTNGFVHAIEEELLTLHTTHSPQFLGLQKGQGLWSYENLNLASDVIVGVIDTGIWPEHQSFNDKGLSLVPSRWKGKCEIYSGNSNNASVCNKKLIGAQVFNKGYERAIIAKIINHTSSDYKSPRDFDGHGTHTASIAGGNFFSNASIFGMANGTAAGMGPTVRIAAYKVCFQEGCYSSDINSAVERAVNDGVDVLSLSLGGDPKPYFNDSIAIEAFHAVKKGVIVSLSAGNDGPNSYTVMNVAPWIMTVAASSTDRDFLADVQLGDGTKLSGTSLSSAHPIKKASLVYSSISNASSFCLSGSLSPSQVTGKVVICDRGISPRVSKGEEVKRVGGVAMILANTEENGDELNADPHVLPTVSLGASAAKVFREYANSYKKPTVSIKFKGTVYHTRAPSVAAFSSRGPSKFDPNILKPDVTAPGINILAAYPPNISPTGLDSDDRRVLFNMFSGTSMSCPHVSGLIALIKSVHGDWSPAAIKSALMTTANVLDSHNSPISDMSDGRSPATPYAFGSGHVDPAKASDPGLIYNISTHDYLNYLCSLKYNPRQIQLFSGRNDTCLDGSSFSPGDLNYPSFSVIFDAKSTRCTNKFTTTHKTTVANVGNSEVIAYTVKVSEPEGVSITVKPRVLNFTRNKNEVSYKVTFNANSTMRPRKGNFSFGDIIWHSGDGKYIVRRDGKYIVRSPVVVVWKE